MKEKIKAYRHGELAFVKTDSVPTLIETKSNVFAKGSEGNSHSFKGGKMYLLEKPKNYLIGYFTAKSTKLYHPQHSPNGAVLPDGNYQILTAIEHTPAGLKVVID